MSDYLSACPSCGSESLVCILGVDLDGCVDCLKFWERLPSGEPYLVDGEPMPFKTPCDNCAFRGKSPERGEPATWESLMYALVHGGRFYCHKGVPFPYREGDEAGTKAFEYPKAMRTITIDGKSTEVEVYDEHRMRLCRGFLNRFVPGRAP